MRLSARCFAVTGLAYIPPWSVNSGIVAGERVTLVIDTGATALSAATICGYATAVRPGNRIAVLNTEPHFDHIGGNGYFRDRGAEIHGHALIARTAGEFEQERAGFNAAIPHPARRSWHEEEAFYHGTYYSTPIANPDHPIVADTALDLGDCTVQLLLTPGHTPANLSVWVAEEGVLYCGDCLVNGYVANLDCGGPAEWREWLRSLDRVEQLRPRAIMPGHGPVALGDEVPRLIETVRKEVERAIAAGVSRTSA